MQSYQGNSGDYMRRGNQPRNSRSNSCQPVMTASSCVGEKVHHTVEMEDALYGMTIAMAYVPWQTWKEVMCPEQALKAGTIFEELNKPFLCKGGC